MWFQKLFKKKEVSPFLGMEFIHKDENGLKWYSFHDKSVMPLTRYLKLQKFIIIWNRNLDNTELSKLIDAAEECIEDGVVKLQGGKRINLIKLVTILSEMRSRHEKIRPFELMADMMAINFVREDEDYYMFDNVKHLEKKNYILDAAKKKDPFFLNTTIFKNLSGSVITSREGLAQFMELSEEQARVNVEKLQYIGGKI